MHLHFLILLYRNNSVALYGLILFYSLTHNELEGRQPLAKFLCIKGTYTGTFPYFACLSIRARDRQ